MCDLCDLNKGRDGFIITICRKCGTNLLVSRVHKSAFSQEEMFVIQNMFPDRKVRWDMRTLPEHTHCHIE